MPRFLKKFNDTLVVKPGSWHGKWYNYWKQGAKYKTSGYRENLCHYVRVLVIWAPAMWIRDRSRPHPAAWKTTLAAFIAIALGAAIWRRPHDMASVGLVVGFIALVAAVWIGMLFLFGWIACMVEPTATWQRFSRWFIKAHVLKVIYPWSVTLGAVLAGGLVFATSKTLQLLLIIAILAGAATLFICVLYWLDEMDGFEKVGQVGETIKVAGHFVSAKKRGICPFIEFEDNTNQAA